MTISGRPSQPIIVPPGSIPAITPPGQKPRTVAAPPAVVYNPQAGSLLGSPGQGPGFALSDHQHPTPPIAAATSPDWVGFIGSVQFSGGFTIWDGTTVTPLNVQYGSTLQQGGSYNAGTFTWTPNEPASPAFGIYLEQLFTEVNITSTDTAGTQYRLLFQTGNDVLVSPIDPHIWVAPGVPMGMPSGEVQEFYYNQTNVTANSTSPFGPLTIGFSANYNNTPGDLANITISVLSFQVVISSLGIFG